MLEEIFKNEVFINKRPLREIEAGTILDDGEERIVLSVEDLLVDEVRTSVKKETERNYRFIFDYSKLRNFESLEDISSDKYVWVGFIKKNMAQVKSTGYIKHGLKYSSNHDLKNSEVDFLLNKWERDYFESEHFRSKNKAIQDYFASSIGRLENYKDNFIFFKDNEIVASLNIKYFFFLPAQKECSAIHLWLDQKKLSKEEKRYIHSVYASELDLINRKSPMFCGVSYENKKGIACVLKYGFIPYFLESKRYD